MKKPKCDCAGCKQDAKVALSLNWGKGGKLHLCEKHLPLWVTKETKVGDTSPKYNAYTVLAIY
jgi:hypothetical protein